MLVKFYQEMQVHALWELIAVCGSQIVLIGFNIILLSLSIANWKKRSSTGRSTSSPSSVVSVGKSEERINVRENKMTAADGSPRVIKAQAAHVVAKRTA